MSSAVGKSIGKRLQIPYLMVTDFGSDGIAMWFRWEGLQGLSQWTSNFWGFAQWAEPHNSSFIKISPNFCFFT